MTNIHVLWCCVWYSRKIGDPKPTWPTSEFLIWRIFKLYVGNTRISYFFLYSYNFALKGIFIFFSRVKVLKVLNCPIDCKTTRLEQQDWNRLRTFLRNPWYTHTHTHTLSLSLSLSLITLVYIVVLFRWFDMLIKVLFFTWKNRELFPKQAPEPPRIRKIPPQKVQRCFFPAGYMCKPLSRQIFK